MSKGDSTISALAQGFYLSEQFQALEIETRDYREHPVLGGISSTRWTAYEMFVAENSRLAAILRQLQVSANAVQLTAQRELAEADDSFLETVAIRRVRASRWALRSPGFLSGDQGPNRLTGSADDDLLMGWGGRDTLIGGKGDDVLSGGRDADRYVYHRRALSAGTEQDEITDFNCSEGDRIVFAWKRSNPVSSFTGRSGEFTISTWTARLAPTSGQVLEPWMYSGTMISVDRDGDSRFDLTVELPGVIDFTIDAITFQ